MMSLSEHENNYDISLFVGYSKEDFIAKMLETAPSMEAIFSGDYHVDHILPVKWFIENGITDQKIVNCLKNLQAITREDNLSKGSKWLIRGLNQWEWCYQLQLSVYGSVIYKEGG